jgi:hypothetical protein
MMPSPTRKSDSLVIKSIPQRTLLLMSIVGGVRRGGSATIRARCDPLPSWNDGATTKSITEFVGRVTANNRGEFVPVPERIAVFDNDGTLWTEQPIYLAP